MSTDERQALVWDVLDERAARAMAGADVWEDVRQALADRDLLPWRARPRLTSRRRTLLKLAGASAAIVIVAVVALLQWSANTAPLLASWSPLPDTPTPALTRIAAELCAPAPLGPRVGERRSAPAPPPPPPLVIDRRGDVAAAFSADAATQRVCFLAKEGPSEDSWRVVGGGGSSNVPGRAQLTQEPVRVDGVTNVGGIARRLTGNSLTAVRGRVRDDVDRVVVRSGGLSITATVTDGFFLAWWPGWTDGFDGIVAEAFSGSVPLGSAVPAERLLR